MIEVSPDEIISFLAGAFSLAAGLIGYSRKKGYKLLPRELEGLEVEFRVNASGGDEQLKEKLNSVYRGMENLPVDELVSIISRARIYSAEGYSQKEALDLGIRLIQTICDLPEEKPVPKMERRNEK